MSMSAEQGPSHSSARADARNPTADRHIAMAAQAGIQVGRCGKTRGKWIPAFAGMTGAESSHHTKNIEESSSGQAPGNGQKGRNGGDFPSPPAAVRNRGPCESLLLTNLPHGRHNTLALEGEALPLVNPRQGRRWQVRVSRFIVKDKIGMQQRRIRLCTTGCVIRPAGCAPHRGRSASAKVSDGDWLVRRRRRTLWREGKNL
jgi:hypothetical protein